MPKRHLLFFITLLCPAWLMAQQVPDELRKEITNNIDWEYYGYAGKLLDSAITIAPKDSSLYFDRGFVRLFMEKPGKAEEDFLKCTELSTDTFFLFDVYQNLGEAAAAQEKYMQAVEYYADALALLPKKGEIYFYIGEMYKKMENYETALDNYEKAASLARYFPPIYLERGVLFYLMGKEDKALADYNFYLDSTVNGQNYDLVLYNRALLHFDNKNMSKAYTDVKSALYANPSLQEGHILLCDIYSHNKDFNYAERQIDKLISYHDTVAEYYSRRGYYRARQGKTYNAIQDFTRAIELDGTETDAYYNRATAYMHLGNDELGLKDLIKAAELEPEYPDNYLNIAMIYADDDRHKEALRFFDKKIALDSDDAQAYLMRGQSRYELAQYTEAISDFEQSLELDFEQKELPMLWLGKSYLKTGNMEKACQYLQSAAAAGNDDAEDLLDDYCQ